MLRRVLVAIAIAIPLWLTGSTAVAGTGPTDGRWQRLTTTGEAVSERSAPTAAGLNHRLYVFGGARDDFATGQATFYNDLHRLDMPTRTWSRLAPAGPVPPARAFAAGSAHPLSQRVFVFGGSVFDVSGTQFTPFDDLWAYSVPANRWSRLGSSSPGPSARSGATMWTVGDQLYLFGGIDAFFATHNDLWRYDLRLGRWSQLAPSGPLPPARHVAQSGEASLGRLTLYGGEALTETGFAVLGDTWEYDLLLNRWRDGTPAVENIDPARNYGASGVIGAALYLQGGDVPGGTGGCGAPFPQNPTAELWRYDLVRHTWRQLRPAGDPLVRLKRHAAATVDGQLFVVAGWDFQCPDGTGPGQIWNHDTYAFTPGF